MKYFFMIVFVVITQAITCADEIKSREAKDAIRKFEKANDDLTAKYQAALKRAHETYLAEQQKLKDALVAKLEEARKAATVDDDLDDALAIRNFAKSLDAPKEVVPNDDAKKS